MTWKITMVVLMCVATAYCLAQSPAGVSKKNLIAHELFDYPPGTSLNSNAFYGSYGWEDFRSWTNRSGGVPVYKVVSGAVGYTDAVNRVLLNGSSSLTNSGAAFAYQDRNVRQLLGQSNTTFYFSFVFQSDFVDILGYRYVGIAYGSKNISGLDQYLVTSEFQGVTNVWGIWAGNAPHKSAVPITSNVNHLCVGKITFDAIPGSDVICLFADPLLASEPSAATYCWTNSTARAGMSSNFVIQAGCRFKMGPLRVGRDWQSVTPFTP